MQEMPLLLFTLCEDFAVGAIVTLAVLDLMGKTLEGSTKFRIGIIAFIACVVGMCLSLLHLGQPLRATNVLAGLGSSWLSREIVFFGGFTLFALIYALVARSGKSAGAVKGVGIVAAILGILAIISTFLCYMLPGVPAWNSAVTPIMFILAAAAMGYTFVKAMMASAAKADDAKKWWIIFVVAVVIFAAWRYFFYADITVLVDTL